MGLRLQWLGTRRLTWHDLLVVVRHSPRSSALYRAQVGQEPAAWGLSERLLAYVLHRVTYLASAWGASGEDLALPTLPGEAPVVDQPLDVPAGWGHWGGSPVPLDEMNERLGADFTARLPKH